ncbi:type II toxin-antitoxin system VapC family toxin [Nocardioides sp. WS12]|uniref:type II toxin-antitoxin system VapC family toxin n=1 Tax=Nocardioides sp. WS12 TaxID=2486272 RepID=UPI0015FC830D|nr:type II toxin-antitoxin system VapC family toxin [Nocardioides sp. WS12]
MNFLLDTNVLSDMFRRNRTVAAWLAAHEDACAISAITTMELERGVLLLERRDPRQAIRLRRWFDEWVLPEFAWRTHGVDTDVALRAAALHVPDPVPINDAYIAATAQVHDLTVVTRNVADFARTGVLVINPYD